MKSCRFCDFSLLNGYRSINRTMLKPIFLLLTIVMTTHTCETSYEALPPLVCGTDGKTYEDNGSFKCTQNKEYGKRVNLQLKHEGPCWPWQNHSDHIKFFFMIVSIYTIVNLLQISNYHFR